MSTISGISGSGAAMPQAMSGASMRMPPQQKMSNLFQMIDTAGAGSITKTQFEQAFNNMNTPAAFKTIGVDTAFAKLDPTGTGKVSKEDFIAGMKSMMTFRHQQHAAVTQPQTLANSTAALNGISIKA
ncbi:MAG TPA: EF-hand domain-containing protein [Gallionella sp.]|nr:EF-hand domain-containing protein [Gallionella sp.]